MLPAKPHLGNAQGGTAGLEEHHIGQQAQQKAIQHHILQRRRSKTLQALASQQEWLLSIMSHLRSLSSLNNTFCESADRCGELNVMT